MIGTDQKTMLQLKKSGLACRMLISSVGLFRGSMAETMYPHRSPQPIATLVRKKCRFFEFYAEGSLMSASRERPIF
jgi:hypothetical protein